MKITQVKYKYRPNNDPYNEYGDGHERTFHVHSDSGEHIATVEHYTTDGGWPRQVTYHHMSNGNPTFNSYKAKRWVPIGDHVGHVNYEDNFDEHGEDLPPKKSIAVNNRNAHKEVVSAISGWSKSVKGMAFLRASHFDSKGNKIPKREDVGESTTRSKLAIIKEVIAESYIDEAKKPKKIRIKVKPQHWAAAKTLWGKRWGGMFHAKTPLSEIPREVEHEGKKITPWSRVVWQARTFAKNDAEKKTKDL